MPPKSSRGRGTDWILIDSEHSPADLENVLGQLQAMAAYPTSPVVRVPWNDTVIIKRYLDIGAQSLLIPNVQTTDEARAAVANTRYPPDGTRGLGPEHESEPIRPDTRLCRAGQPACVRHRPDRDSARSR